MTNSGVFMGGFSGALAKENLKRQWYLPVIIFMLYFLTGIFPLLFLNNGAGDYARASLANANFLYGSLMTYIPIVVSCVAMWYLHKPEKAFALHAQPYSRGKLFNTHVVSGWFMIVVPVVIMGLIYMALSGSITVKDMDTGVVERAYTIGTVAKWMIESISIYTFAYGLCTLAGAIVGNTVTQVLGTLVFYNLVPALIGIVLLYSDLFLTGYDEPSQTAIDILINSDPFLGTLLSFFTLGFAGDLGDLGTHMISREWYFLFGLIFILAAKFAVYKGRLEKVGDSMIFSKVETAVTVGITFIGGAFCGIFLGLISNNAVAVIILALLGACLSFFLVKLILERSVRIFNRKNMTVLIVSLLILLIFILVFVCDLTGYSRRVPAEDNITAVDARGLTNSEMGNYISDSDEIFVYGDKCTVEDRELIKRVHALHEYAAEHELYDLSDAPEGTKVCNLKFSYKLKNGRTLTRQFMLRTDKESEKLINDVLNSEALKESFMISDEFKNCISRAEITKDIYHGENGYENRYAAISGKDSKVREEIIGLIDAYNKEIKGRKYDFSMITEKLASDGSIYEDNSDQADYEPEPVDQSYATVTIYYDSDKVEKRYFEYEPSVSFNVYKENNELSRAMEDCLTRYLVSEETYTD